jgi:uncharacterized protein involved in response to NO
MHRSLLLPATAVPGSRPSRLAIAAKGFRPFFFLAALFAITIVPLWLLVLQGKVHASAYLEPTSWHAHEMVFGFVTAVLAGFLLTAVGNWTSRETAVGLPLLALALLWVVGRVAMLFAAALPRGVPALVDLAFLPALIVTLARPLWAAKNRRNFVMLAILTALFAADAVTHADALGVLPAGSARRASLVSIDVILIVILIIAGRVFPMFTRNATGASSIRSLPVLDALAVSAMSLLTVLDVLLPASRTGAALSGLVALLAIGRAVHWGARYSLRQPLVWILHTGYAWLVVGLLLRAVAGSSGAFFGSLATHALTVGAIGSLTLGMMARVALGHTGRTLVPSPKMTWAFVAINLAAIARVGGPIVAPARYFESLVGAAVLWSVAFGLFLGVYAPLLMQPRVDGKPG